MWGWAGKDEKPFFVLSLFKSHLIIQTMFEYCFDISKKKNFKTIEQNLLRFRAAMPMFFWGLTCCSPVAAWIPAVHGVRGLSWLTTLPNSACSSSWVFTQPGTPTLVQEGQSSREWGLLSPTLETKIIPLPGSHPPHPKTKRQEGPVGSNEHPLPWPDPAVPMHGPGHGPDLLSPRPLGPQPIHTPPASQTASASFGQHCQKGC